MDQPRLESILPGFALDFILFVIHGLFSAFLFIRRSYHSVFTRSCQLLKYHHKTPQYIRNDVSKLNRIPDHYAVILDGEVDDLIAWTAEIACWCACAGIKLLTVFERRGQLKDMYTVVHREVGERLQDYMGTERPRLAIRSPHTASFVNGDLTNIPSQAKELKITLISSEDGRDSIVDLAKTLCSMSKSKSFKCDELSQEVVDFELSSVMTEPDLLVLFSPKVKLQGFPPWQLRLTEIFHIQDNDEVNYAVFLKSLYKFSQAEMRFGR